MGTVVIAGNPYDIFGTLAAAVIYHQGSSRPTSVAWLVATGSAREQSLVDATRVLDEQAWAGVETTPGVQPLAWPRTGVTYPDGTAVPSGTTPVQIENATYELAALLLAKPTLLDMGTMNSNIESVTAGPVNVSFFAPVMIGRWPVSVQRLIAWFLAGASGTGGAYAESTGECAESQFDDSDRYERS